MLAVMHVSVVCFPCFGDLEHKTAKGGGAGSLGRHSLAFSSENVGQRPLKEAVERADELEDEAIVVEGEALEEEPSEEGDEDPESEGKKTAAAVPGERWREIFCSYLLLNRGTPQVNTVINCLVHQTAQGRLLAAASRARLAPAHQVLRGHGSSCTS